MIKISLIGLFSGLINGLFSTGAGMLLVPLFIYILKLEDKISRGTAIFCILIMVITSSIFYYQNDYIDWHKSILLALGGIIGGILGAKILKKLDEKYLKVIFIVFLIYIGFSFIF